MSDDPSTPITSPLEIWAGLECTVNRVNGTYRDQCRLNGHVSRPDDIERFAALGVKTIRYPVLWETLVDVENGVDEKSPYLWDRVEPRLQTLRDCGLNPIAGLLHHGSGPKWTSLLDPGFALAFARYARVVAERFPWLRDYTPINEPLTTARFSGLYGVWYPHQKSDPSFARCLLNQIKGIALAMREIRNVNPRARLIFTEDLGRAQGTEATRTQVDFENHRRWLSLDLLMGRVNRSHPLRRYLIERGRASEAELEWFLENPCPPEIFGINHYPLSNRFLDDEVDLYPKGFHGHNGSIAYADVGAVDTARATPPTPASVFLEAWERYGIPIAVTEAHIAGGREAQLRWLWEIWRSAKKLRAEGCDIRAVTAWSLLGSVDWASLCTRFENRYESGVFDIRAPVPRPTAVAILVATLAEGREPDHPVLERAGYWREPIRVLFPEPPPLPEQTFGAIGTRPTPHRPILITGATGTLGSAFARVCAKRGLDFVLVSRREVDISDPRSISRALDHVKPWALINAAGYVRVDDAENEPERCRNENTLAAARLAEACAARGISIATFSSDLVFDGRAVSPYLESAEASPLNVYGRSKAEAEAFVLQADPRALVIRTSTFFGPWDEFNHLTRGLKALRHGRPWAATNDQIVSPTYLPDLVDNCLDLLIDGEGGIVHLANKGQVSFAAWTRMGAELLGVDTNLVDEISATDCGARAPRPCFSALASERFQIMPTLEDAMERYVFEFKRRQSTNLERVLA